MPYYVLLISQLCVAASASCVSLTTSASCVLLTAPAVLSLIAPAVCPCLRQLCDTHCASGVSLIATRVRYTASTSCI